MKVGLHTVDLFPGRERLMPFRTILEVAKVMNENGWQAHILNSSVSIHDAKDYEWSGIKIVQCPRDFKELSIWVNNNSYDAFYFAATIREGLRDLSPLKDIKCKKIAYVPSGITLKKNAIKLFMLYGMFAKAWVLEAFTPKKIIANKLLKAGFTDIICLTDYTSQQIGNVLTNHCIYPGKDDFEFIKPDFSIVRKNDLLNKKFFLFTGAPGQVRGSQLLLKAFDRFVSKQGDNTPLLVFLLRNDVGAQYDLFNKTLNTLKHKENVIVLRERLSVPQFKAFMEQSYSVILPFICIPAEVPLTYFEVMSCGTPVVSFENAGTTQYLSQGLHIVKKLEIGSLCNSLMELWNSNELRDILSFKSKELMNHHPTWKQVGIKWMKILKND